MGLYKSSEVKNNQGDHVAANFKPCAIGDLQTPSLLLDPRRMARNIVRMRQQITRLGVGFRPHVKTAKCLEVISLLSDNGALPVTVSTLQEAEQLAQVGYRDILYAVGMIPNKIARVQALRDRGVDIKVIVDNPEAAAALSAAAVVSDNPVPVLIEIDSDGHRAGVKPDDVEALRTTAANLSGGVCLGGVLTHAGGSYSSHSQDEIRGYAERETRAVVDAAEALRKGGYQVDIVSLGSTPSVLFSDDMTGVTEARAGVFVFFDLVMAGLQVCDVDDIAISVLASVGTVQADRGRFIVDAGWTAMSRDRGTSVQKVDQGYGLVCDIAGRPIPDLIMTEANQEHGVLALREGSTQSLPDLGIGDLVRILPNHACATAGQHAAYSVIDEEQGGVVDRWSRFGGW